MPQKNREEDNNAEGIVKEMEELRKRNVELEFYKKEYKRLKEAVPEGRDKNEGIVEAVLELRIRNDILEIFHTTPDDQVYGELLKLLLEVFKSKYGTFGYFDHEGSFFIPSMTREIYWQNCRVADKETIFKKGTFSGIWARAINEKKTLYSNDGPFRLPEGHIPIKNTMVTPIIYHDQVISAIHLANKETDYNEGDRRLSEAIANHLAPVLNARMERDKLEKERRQTEQAILRSEERLAHAQEIAHVGCWEINLNSKELWWSDEFYRIFGVVPGEFTPSRESLSKLIPPGDLAALNKAYETTITHGEPMNLEHRLVRPDGSERWVHAVGRLERDADGTPARLFGTSLDITERKKTENELSRLYEQTRNDSEAKTILLREINHRVKNNLAMIFSLLTLQSELIDDPGAKSAFDNTRQRIHSMAIIHEKIYQSESLTNIDAREYFSSIITELNKAYGSLQKLILIHVDVENISLPLYDTIPCGLILHELLTNAFKYSFQDGERGEITVEFHKRDNRFILSVGDNGVGLPADVNFREAKSMGLQLVNILTQQLKGEIKLDQGKGTLFEIAFPAAR